MFTLLLYLAVLTTHEANESVIANLLMFLLCRHLRMQRLNNSTR